MLFDFVFLEMRGCVSGIHDIVYFKFRVLIHRLWQNEIGTSGSLMVFSNSPIPRSSSQVP
jgi:hypothetical protein